MLCAKSQNGTKRALDPPQRLDYRESTSEDRGHKAAGRNKPLRGIQHRPLGSGLVIRAVFLAGLPDA